MAPAGRNVLPSPAPQTATTLFLLTNLHCPTCVSTIKGILQESRNGQVGWVSPNIVTSVVTVEHDPAASLGQMQRALEDNGFEVCAIATPTGDVSDLDLGDMSTATHKTMGAGPSNSPTHTQPSSFLSRWVMPSKESTGRPENLKVHLKNCAHCRDSQQRGLPGNVTGNMQQVDFKCMASRNTFSSDSQPASPPKSFIAVETSEFLLSHPVWRAKVAIGGMTCASCSNKVAEELRNLDWATNVNVDLVSNSATVDLLDKDKGSELVQVIEDLGYEAILDSITDVNAGKRKRREGSDIWRATLSIGGMTCASCSNKIVEQMKKKDWVKDITVSLVSNSATIDFQGQHNADKLVEAIEELGFDAASDTVVSLEDDEQPSDEERTVEIKIDGLYCSFCPARVAKSLAGFRRQLKVISEPTAEKPIIKIRYIPDAPSFTIRQILAAIDASDPGNLTASLYHPPTLEERSKMMQRRHRREILWRVILSGIVAIPTFVIGIVYMSLLPHHKKMYMMEPLGSSRVNRMQIALFIMATPVYFFAADIFHRKALKEIRVLWRRGSQVPILRRFYRFGSMNTLMSLGTSISYFASVAQMIAIGAKAREMDDSNFYFDSVVFLTFFLLLGRFIESLSKSKTGEAVEMLVKLRPTTATFVSGYGTEKEEDVLVTADLLDYGDVVRVPHGSSPPSDGIIVEGTSNFDESSLTGESRPVKKVPGDQVFSGTVNKDGSVLVRITGIPGQSLLDQIVNIVREGQTKRAPIEQVADSLTSYFVPAITLVAIITWLVWLTLGFSGVVPRDFLDKNQTTEWVSFSLQFSIAVFVVACPCGLGLAAPTAIFVGAGLAAKYGILAKGGGEAFQKASQIDCVVFDKTGTLTVGGEPTITDSEVYPPSDDERDALLAELKAVEENSSHPIAKAIVSFCTIKKQLPKTSISNIQEIPGKGMKAVFEPTTNGQTSELIVGNEQLMKDFAVEISPERSQLLQKWKQEAKSVALVAAKSVSETESSTWRLAAMLAISDPIRPEARPVIRALQDRGTRVWMLSGDNPTTAAAVAQQLGIPQEQVIAGVLPAGKAEKITYLQSTLKARTAKNTESATRRSMVAMVGDGINDSPALTTADVGIAIGSGSDVAISSADFVLMKSDLKAVVTLLDLSTTILRRIKFNFGWAVVYNVIAIPFAAGAFYPIKANGNHIKLDPAFAALAMALSSISVVVSSLLLKTRWFGYKERKLSGI
ncbi:E1-E2 ATPase-domain-containing protein [Podospora fimiseda]|uniref:E1-E2 ATPase-domain-containing protein n=1 Tax=Podospora fimiseda TaxID=252190 RepID=A0AAN7H2Q7_9PEZI|nr:E1-E2 ATPase-domain-containing protein [Podospora fimiseda]